jgi:hypothetical protein
MDYQTFNWLLMRNTARTENLELPETWLFDSAHALDRQEWNAVRTPTLDRLRGNAT